MQIKPPSPPCNYYPEALVQISSVSEETCVGAPDFWVIQVHALAHLWGYTLMSQ